MFKKKNAKKRWSKTTVSGPSSESSTWSPKRICTILTVLAAIGLILGFALNSGLVVMFVLIPPAIYQVIRTAGPRTKVASIVLLICLVVEIILLVFNIEYDVARFLGQNSMYAGMYSVPLGDARLVLPFLMVLAAITLLFRTAGTYTKWLSGIIILCTFSALYILFPEEFPALLQWAFKRASRFLYLLF